MSIDGLGLRATLAQRLKDAGYETVAAIEAVVPRDLLAIEGLGPKSLETIAAALAAQGSRLAEDAYAPYTCARDGVAGFGVKLTELWLCDDCADDFTARPFAGIEAVYVSAPVDGYCVNCVAWKPDIALRQWHLCDLCARVAQSFGRSVVASRALLTHWDESYRAETGIKLVEVDPPRLNRREGNVVVATKASAIDWEGRDERTDEVIFGIEQKTGQKGLGRGSVDPMSEFQLDTSDCDDIAAVAERRMVPVYVLHAQVVERAVPPTRLFVPAGYWWTDAFSMGERCTSVRPRPRERRPAAYYPVDIFRPLAAFADYLQSGGVDEFVRRTNRDGRFPALYPGQLRRVAGSAADA